MKKTSEYLLNKKVQRQCITVLTCYDYPTALWEEEAGVDVILVGDSVGTNVLGYQSVRDVTLNDMRHHLKAVKRGVNSAYLLVDLPYRTYDNPTAALQSSEILLDVGADGIKLEGHKPQIINHLVNHGVEVCAHLGLNPQLHEKHTLQAKNAEAALQLVDESLALQEAGAFMIVYEMITEKVAQVATQRLNIPTIGIGAGRYTDGQVLVVNDMLGVNDFELRHCHRYEEFYQRGRQAIQQYVADVQDGHFPQAVNARHMSEMEAERFRKYVWNQQSLA